MIIAHQTVLPLQAYLILLCFTLSHFKDIEGLWQPFMEQFIGTIFPPHKAFAYYMSLHHILVILAMSQIFHS